MINTIQIIEDYEEAAMRTAKEMGSFEMNLIHAAMGLSSDAGEFVDCIKKFAIYGKELDKENAIEELGDVLWFVVLAGHTLDVSLREIMQANINKLAIRYPDKYTNEAAITRADKEENVSTQEPYKDTRYPHQKEMDECGDVVKFISPDYIDAANYRYSYGPCKQETAVAYGGNEVLTIIHKECNKDKWNAWYSTGTKVPA